MKHKVIEILQYTLKKGTGEAFHNIMKNVSVPLHQASGIDVVAYGNSLHDSDAYYLIRVFESLENLETVQERFYQSEAWRKGPREAIIEKIGSSLKTVVMLPEEAVEVLRTANATKGDEKR